MSETEWVRQVAPSLGSGRKALAGEEAGLLLLRLEQRGAGEAS